MRCRTSSRDPRLGKRDRYSSPLPMQWRTGSSTRTTILGFSKDASIGDETRAKILTAEHIYPLRLGEARCREVSQIIVRCPERKIAVALVRPVGRCFLVPISGACLSRLRFTLSAADLAYIDIYCIVRRKSSSHCKEQGSQGNKRQTNLRILVTHR